MDKFDFDPFAQNVTAMVKFCERMEAADETGKHQKDSSDMTPKKKPKSYNKYDKKKGSGGKWCDFHETDTHNTKDCETLKKMKASKSGTPAKKQWKSKSDYAKDKAKKELNVLKKKAKKAKKELNAVSAKRKQAEEAEESDDGSFHSLNALERNMQDVDDQLDALNFSDAEEGETCKA